MVIDVVVKIFSDVVICMLHMEQSLHICLCIMCNAFLIDLSSLF